MKIHNSTLVYIEHEGRYLMLHRIKKKNDVNHDKWIGVGGKFEAGESPEECMEREVFEETGLTVEGFLYCGIVTFVSTNYDTEDEVEYIHLFKVTDFSGELKDCDEGELVWVEKKKLLELPHWKGDELFLSLIQEGGNPFFSMKLVYEGGVLVESVLDTVPVFITEHLLLRPWSTNDASNLYYYARETEIGLRAGWQPHKSEGESMEVIYNYLMKAGSYAIVLKETNEVIGAVAIFAGSKEERGLGEDPYQAEIGYWIGKPYWGRGYAGEAVKPLVEFGFSELELNKIWIAFYDGNEASKRVAEKLGFSYHHTNEHSFVKLLNEERVEHFMILEN